MQTQSARLLVKGGVGKSTPLRAAGNSFRSAETAAGWQAYETAGSATLAQLWDAAYELQENTGEPAEPDAEYIFRTPGRAQQRGVLAGAANGDRGIVNRFDPEVPSGGSFGWHLGESFSELAKARDAAGSANIVRAAIFDVGFQFNHKAAPEKIRKDLQRNFAEDGRPDAADPDIGGFLQNPGHGTAVVAILAGGALGGVKAPTPDGFVIGGAPAAQIVPIRVATSVLLLRTSAFAQALEYVLSLSPANTVDVVSMSMGGLASEAWADIVNRAYEQGLFIVTAAGNNFGAPKSIVFPARFHRVLAATGVMADGRPYDLPFPQMSGNYGPGSKMNTAIAAFTPNIPWAELGDGDIIDWDGVGTSAATPQVAAAALLWLQKHRAAIASWDGWQRVEMVREALFRSADRSSPFTAKHFGRGILKANRALAIAPSDAIRGTLRKQPTDSASFGLLRLLRGTILRIDEAPRPLERGFETEIAQLIQRDAEVEAAIPDPDSGRVSPEELRRFVDAAVASPLISSRLREELKVFGTMPGGGGMSRPGLGGKQVVEIPTPARRQLRVFAFDPAAGQSLETADINCVTIDVPWEEQLQEGPSGEYVEVVDHDPASGCYYAPVDLNDPSVLANDGVAPAEGNPKFHQQMVYAVAMRTIETFEGALGRKSLWSPVMDGKKDAGYVGKLRIYPHALRDKNAFYNPLKKALLFGYFPARPAKLGEMYPGGIVFTCLSHDVVAHETAHALLDGMARTLVQPTNTDMLAFHEAFADIVALFQHFSLPGVLRSQIAAVRGDLRTRSLLGELAQQFGQATGLHGALRSYIGKGEPDPSDLENAVEQHARGAVLVAAVFDAFVAIYERRIADLKRIASEGTGVLRPGALHPDLVNRLAEEARISASHVLRMCVRAIDYCPPVDLNFGDFLRALITADLDLYPEDAFGYRIAMMEAFRKRGIYPRDVRTLSEDSLRWRGPEEVLRQMNRDAFEYLSDIGDEVRKYSNRDQVDGKPARQAIFEKLRTARVVLYKKLQHTIRELDEPLQDEVARSLGLTFEDSGRRRVEFEVHSLNFANRVETTGRSRRDAVLMLKQERWMDVDGEPFRAEGGCTLIADCDRSVIRFAVRKSILSRSRQRQVRDFLNRGGGLGMTYFGASPLTGPGGRFAMVHRMEGQEDTYA